MYTPVSVSDVTGIRRRVACSNVSDYQARVVDEYVVFHLKPDHPHITTKRTKTDFHGASLNL